MDSIMSEREKRQVVPRELLSKEFFRNFGIPLLVPYTKNFGRITQF